MQGFLSASGDCRSVFVTLTAAAARGFSLHSLESAPYPSARDEGRLQMKLNAEMGMDLHFLKKEAHKS